MNVSYRTKQRAVWSTGLFLCGFYAAFILLSWLELQAPFGSQQANVVNISASVPDNPYNTLARELGEKETQLMEREQSIAAREEALLRVAYDRTTLILSVTLAVGCLLLVLILVNFYLDWRARGVLLRR